MPVIAAIGITISAITSGFVTAIKFGAEAALKLASVIAKLGVELVKFAGQIITKVISSIVSLSATIIKFTTIALVGLGAAMIAIGIKAIKTAASFEELESKFETLLKSAILAKQRMKELKQFAAETPFQIKGIANASIILQSLTKGALATGKGLRMVGDAAAVAGRPMNELAVQIGRVFQAAISGRKAGEALARLQELGILSGAARTEFEDLQNAGKKGTDVFAIISAELKKTDGAMERLSKTASGLFSTLKDNLNLALAQLGEIFAPFVKVVLVKAISAFQKLSALIKENAASIKIFIASGIKKIAPIFLQIGKIAAAVFGIMLSFFNIDGPKGINNLIEGLGTFLAKVQFVAKNFKTAFKIAFDFIKIQIKKIASFAIAIGETIVIAISKSAALVKRKLAGEAGIDISTARKISKANAKALARAGTFGQMFGLDKNQKAELAASITRLRAHGEKMKKELKKNPLDFFAEGLENVPLRADVILANRFKITKKSLEQQKAVVDDFLNEMKKEVPLIKLGNKEELKDFNKELDKLIDKIRFDEFGSGILAGVGEVMNAVQLLGKAADDVNDAGEKSLKSKLPTLALAGSQAAARGELGLLGPDKMLKVANEQLAVQKQIRDKPVANGVMGDPVGFGFGGG